MTQKNPGEGFPAIPGFEQKPNHSGAGKKPSPMEDFFGTGPTKGPTEGSETDKATKRRNNRIKLR